MLKGPTRIKDHTLKQVKANLWMINKGLWRSLPLTSVEIAWLQWLVQASAKHESKLKAVKRIGTVDRFYWHRVKASLLKYLRPDSPNLYQAREVKSIFFLQTKSTIHNRLVSIVKIKINSSCCCCFDPCNHESQLGKSLINLQVLTIFSVTKSCYCFEFWSPDDLVQNQNKLPTRLCRRPFDRWWRLELKQIVALRPKAFPPIFQCQNFPNHDFPSSKVKSKSKQTLLLFRSLDYDRTFLPTPPSCRLDFLLHLMIFLKLITFKVVVGTSSHSFRP
jgi:hypothetical protein